MSAPPDPSSAAPERRLAVVLMLGGIASVQLGSALATTLFDEIGPGGAVFLRNAFAAIVLLAIWRPARTALDRAAARDVVAFGFVLGSMNLCFYESLDRLPLGIAVTFEFVGPLTVALLGSRRRIDLVWAGLAAAGIVLFAPEIGNGLEPLGVALALAAGGFWGLYILTSARVGRGSAGLGGLSTAMTISAVLLTPLGVADGGGGLLEWAPLAGGLGVAILSSAIPYTVELLALRRLPPSTFGVILSLEPAVAALVGAVALDQALAGRELLAVVLVVIASAGALRTGPVLEVPEA